MSYVFNGPGVIRGEKKNGDLTSEPFELTAGCEIPDGFISKETMAYLEKQGKISKRTFVDKAIKPKVKKEESSDENS